MDETSSAPFDPRLTPARPDRAAKHLEGRVTAERFVPGIPRDVIEALAPMRQSPSPDAALLTEALRGERVTVYETTDEGWSWGQLQADGYVGWLPSHALGAPGPALTHKIIALRSLVFPGPDIKLPPIDALPFGARLAVTRIADRFGVATAGGHIPLAHLVSIDHADTDFVAVAQRFVGSPYLWGGKTSLGIDCSGLVQVALTACGISCPRDSDMQEKALGSSFGWGGDVSRLQRGDLLFWPGHVAIVADGSTLLHANAFHMAVACEPLPQAIRRIAESGAQVRAVKRLPPGRGDSA